MKKKILFFVPLPPPVTGAGLRNKSLVESPLLNGAFQIRVLPFNFAEKVSNIGRFSILKVLRSISRGIQIIWLVIAFRPHLVYFNFSLYGFALYRDTMYAALFKILGCKLVYHLRTQGVSKQIHESLFKRKIFQFVFWNVHVISLSEFLSRDVQEVYRGKPIVVNNGIPDVSHLYPAKTVLEDGRVRILFVGHLWKFKGVLDLINALASLKHDKRRFQAMIVGPEGDLQIADLRNMVLNLGMQEDVQIVGTKEGNDKHEIFRNSDIFVLPTHWEAFPGVVLEAMQFGVPVVATREGAIPEIVVDGVTGLLVNKGDVTDLAEKIGTLIMDSALREKFGHNGRHRFEEKYDVSRFEGNMKIAFETVLNDLDADKDL